MLIKLILIFAILASCAPAPAPYSERSFTEKGYGSPFGYQLSGKCFIGEESSQAGSTLFVGGEYLDVELSTPNSPELISSIELGGYYVFDLRQSRILAKRYNKNYFNDCFTEARYSEKNYEDALISILSVFQDFQFNHSSYLKKHRIANIRIQVLPSYEEREGRLSRNKQPKYMINNAFYSSLKNTLVFLPQGEETKTQNVPFGAVPLWKSPAVILHEYAHHIFNEFVDARYFATANSFGSCSKEHASRIDQVLDLNSSKRIISKQVVMQALNEGFADLFSYLVNDQKNLYLNMGRMERTRDVESPYYQSYESKTLTNDRLDIFLREDRKDIAGVNFSGIHTIGASFAHHANQLLIASGMNKKQKLDIVTLWLKRLPATYRKSKSSRALIKNSYKTFYQVVKRQTVNTVSSTVCENYFKGIPSVQFDCSL